MLRIFVSGKTGRFELEHPGGTLEFGRGPRRQAPRVTLRDDPSVSGDHLRVEELPGRRLRLSNLSRRFGVGLASGDEIPPEGEAEVALPARLRVGNTIVQIEEGRAPEPDQDTLMTVQSPLRPGETLALAGLSGLERGEGIGDGVAPGTLARWFEAVVAVQRASASSDEFYQQTAQAVVELIGLDAGLVLLRRADRWEVAARSPATSDAPPKYSRTVLDRLLAERRTFYHDVPPGAALASLAEVEAVVAAPVLGPSEEVVGAVYGARNRRPGLAAIAIRPLEAQLVQVLAAAVAAGLARLQSEADAARRRVQFEQFFSSELARELDRDPSLLQGREREVTVLFSDIRGFSRFSENLSPGEVCELACDVLDALTERIGEHGGVVVSYSGDGLLALWNAPREQPDHADLACRAALAMHSELPAIERRWQHRLGRPLRIGIGINSGPALVGNMGSRKKFAYGPQGHAVNLASRVEGATKQIGVPILITGSTRALLKEPFATRRLCQVRVLGMDGAVELHELRAPGVRADWASLRDGYEEGLAHFEAGRWGEACKRLHGIVAAAGEGDIDAPTLALIGRCIEALRDPPRVFDGVLQLDRK